MSESDLYNNYPGVDRLQYFLYKLGMIAAVVFVVTVFGPHSPVMKIMGLALMVASMILDVMRLRNIGLSQWYAFIRFLPFGNAILDIGLQCAQPGWAETHRLDRAGRQILIFELIMFALMLFMFWRVRMVVPFWL